MNNCFPPVRLSVDVSYYQTFAICAAGPHPHSPECISQTLPSQTFIISSVYQPINRGDVTHTVQPANPTLVRKHTRCQVFKQQNPSSWQKSHVLYKRVLIQLLLKLQCVYMIELTYQGIFSKIILCLNTPKIKCLVSNSRSLNWITLSC